MISVKRARRAVVWLAWAAASMAAPARADEPAGQEPAADPAWQLYDQAFAELAVHNPEAARELLTRLHEDYPSHPAALRAEERLGALDAQVTRPPDMDTQPRDALAESPSQIARGELALLMTLHSTWFALDVCEMLECENSRGIAASLMLGGGGGLALSLYLTRDGITPGAAQLYDSAITWGAWNAFGINGDIAEEPSEAGVQVAGQALGLAAGLGLWHLWRPTSGEVALANTGGIWSGVLTLLAYGVAQGDDFDPDLSTITIASDVGLLMGGAIARQLPGISRGRTLLIDTGGILGFLAGGLLVVSTQPDDTSDIFLMFMGGTSAGLGVAAVVTRDWDAPSLGHARLGLMPMGHKGWGAALSLDLD